MGPDLQLPLVADRNMKISRDYGVLIEDEGITLRGLFLIDQQGILRFDCCFCVFWLGWVTNLQTSRQITVNDLPVGRSVEETIRLIKAFQFSVRPLPLTFHVFMLSDDIVVISASSFLSTLSHYCLVFWSFYVRFLTCPPLCIGRTWGSLSCKLDRGLKDDEA